MRRLVIAVDCDDVLVSTTPFFVDAYNKTYGTISQGMSKDGAILFGNYPWNEAGNSHEDITHCFDWDAVKNVVDELAHHG